MNFGTLSCCLTRRALAEPGAAESLMRIPPGQDFRIMDCGVAGLRFVDLMYFLASWGCGLAFFEKKT